MRILVTGGVGFIGHNVVRLLEKDHEVVSYDSETNYCGSIPDREIIELVHSRKSRIGSKSIYGDIRDQHNLSSVLGIVRPDTIVHLASYPRQKTVSDSPVTAADVMITGLVRVLENCKAYGISKFVFISSSMIYGDFDNGTTEEAIGKPTGQYGVLKYAGEQLVRDFCNTKGINYVIIRPSAVYGEYDVNDRVIAKFLTTAIKGGEIKVRGSTEILDFTHVNDTAAGIALATTTKVPSGSIFNITRSGVPYTLLDAARMAVEIAGNGTIVCTEKDDAFPSRGILCIDHARRLLNYNPTINLYDGLTQYHNWLISK